MQPDEMQKVKPVTPPAAKKAPGNKVKKIVRFLNGNRVIKRRCGDGFYLTLSKKDA